MYHTLGNKNFVYQFNFYVVAICTITVEGYSKLYIYQSVVLVI
jgi:hypothetical protein